MIKKFERIKQVGMILKSLSDEEASPVFDGDGYASYITYINGYFVHVWQESDKDSLHISTNTNEYELGTAGQVIDKINTLFTGVK